MKKKQMKKTNNGIFYVVISLVAVLAVCSVGFAYSGYSAPKYNAESGANIIVNEAQVIQPAVYGDVSVLPPIVEGEVLGSGSGQDHYVPERFWAGFGGGVYATTTVSTTETITEGLLQRYSVFEITPLVAGLTWTLPATSTLATLLRNEGDTQRWIFHNATTTTGATFTLAKGVGWDLTGVDANADVIAGAAVGSQVYMVAECTRLRTATSTYITMAGTILCGLEEYIAAD